MVLPVCDGPHKTKNLYLSCYSAYCCFHHSMPGGSKERRLFVLQRSRHGFGISLNSLLYSPSNYGVEIWMFLVTSMHILAMSFFASSIYIFSRNKQALAWNCSGSNVPQGILVIIYSVSFLACTIWLKSYFIWEHTWVEEILLGFLNISIISEKSARSLQKSIHVLVT